MQFNILPILNKTSYRTGSWARGITWYSRIFFGVTNISHSNFIWVIPFIKYCSIGIICTDIMIKGIPLKWRNKLINDQNDWQKLVKKSFRCLLHFFIKSVMFTTDTGTYADLSFTFAAARHHQKKNSQISAGSSHLHYWKRWLLDPQGYNKRNLLFFSQI